MILKSTQAIKEETATEKERFFITNIIKGHKVTNLTRPNEFGTMMSKVAIKSPGRIGSRNDYVLLATTRHKVTNLTRPNEFGTMMSKVATKSPGRIGSGNDYVLLATTRQKTTNSDTLFSSKEGRSASKMDISSIVGQLRPGEAHRHQSTQARCDPRSDADLHRTVVRQCGRINSKLLDDGTYPTSQDFFHLPPRTTWYNATARLVYL
jgi:hypothetical protein